VARRQPPPRLVGGERDPEGPKSTGKRRHDNILTRV
jgi:hypothetical protein